MAHSAQPPAEGLAAASPALLEHRLQHQAHCQQAAACLCGCASRAHHQHLLQTTACCMLGAAMLLRCLDWRHSLQSWTAAKHRRRRPSFGHCTALQPCHASLLPRETPKLAWVSRTKDERQAPPFCCLSASETICTQSHWQSGFVCYTHRMKERLVALPLHGSQQIDRGCALARLRPVGRRLPLPLKSTGTQYCWGCVGAQLLAHVPARIIISKATETIHTTCIHTGMCVPVTASTGLGLSSDRCRSHENVWFRALSPFVRS